MAITDEQLTELIDAARKRGERDFGQYGETADMEVRDLAAELLDELEMPDAEYPGEMVSTADLADQQDYRDIAAAYMAGFNTAAQG